MNRRIQSVIAAALLAPAVAAAFQITTPDRERLTAERPQRIQAAQAVLDAQRTILGLTPDDTFQPASSSYDDLGRLHVRFHRYYKGVRVMGGDLKVGVAPEGAGGRVDTRPGPTAAMPNVQPAIARKDAIAALARELRLRSSDLDVTAELVLDENGKTPILAWLLRVDADDLEPTNYLVDAVTGATVRTWPAITEALVPEQSTGETYRYGQIDLDHVHATVLNRYELQDATRGYTRVYDMQDKKPSSGFQGALYTQAPNDPDPTTWGNGEDWKFGDSTSGARGQTAAVEAYYAARLTWDLYKNVFNRDGIDDAGSPMKLRVHIRKKKDEHYGDAYWDGTYANFGDGGESDNISRTDTITVGHELGHGLWGAAVTGDNSGGERRGLNEGHGDIQGTIVNHYRALADGAGTTVPTKAPHDVSLFYGRDINPWGYRVSGQAGLPYYVDGMGDYEEHLQGTAYARMFATLAAGAPSVEEYENGPECEASSSYKEFGCLVSPLLSQGMAGIGVHKAARIWYLATTAYLDGNPTFAETRDAYLQAADDLYGLNSPEYKSTMNAWRAINVGDEAADTAAPTITLANPLLNDYEQTLVVATTAQDDIGVDHIDVLRNAVVEHTEFGGAWVGLIDLSQVSFGNYTLTASAYDRLGKYATRSKPLPYHGANYLLRNRGFEQGGTNWSTNSGANVQSDKGKSFLGDGYADFSDAGWIRQKFSVPSGIIGLVVGYRVSVDPTAGLIDPGERLDVEIQRGDGTVIQTLDTIHADLDTSDELYHDYKQFHHTLPLDYAGRDYYLRFRSTMARAGRYRIDNVYVAYDGVPNADLLVDVDEAEGSVTFQVKNVTGIDMSQVKEIRIAQPGTEGTRLGTQLMAVRPTSDFQLDTDYQVNASIIDVLDNEVATIGPVHFQVHKVNQLLINPGFEGGNGWWDLGGAADVVHYNPGWGEGNAAFLGGNWARLGGLGVTNTARLRQIVDIPEKAVNVKLTFRLRTDSSELIPSDTLTVNILEFGTYNVLETVAAIPGSTDTHTTDNYHGQQRFNGYDLSAYKGQKIILEFRADEDDGLTTWFHIDNVGLTYETLGLAP